MGDPTGFYGPDQAWIHDVRFGDLARRAAELVVARLGAAGHRSGTVVDLGSGSGILAAAVGAAGYEVVGVDISPAMVELARARAPEATFHLGSLHDFAIPAAVAVTAIGEALCYLEDPASGEEAFAALVARVRAALPPGGVFTFDVATSGRYGDRRAVERVHDHDTWFLGMRAEESADGRRLDRRIAIFRRSPEEGAYRRTDEHHVLRLYEPAVLVRLLEAQGFAVEVRPAYAAPSASTPAAGWVVVVATRT